MPSDAVHTAFKTKNANVNAQWLKEEGVNITDYLSKETIPANRCTIRFDLPEDIGPPVLFYYHLTNFYQNHRRYVDSFDSDQLKGKPRSYGDIKGSDCTPLKGDEQAQKPYYPCGLIANSLFNDTFTSPLLLNPSNGTNNDTELYEMDNNTNIAWGSDKDLYGNTQYKFDEVLPPPNWRARYPNNYTADAPPPNLTDWAAFQVWMRTAGLPTFSKLYQRNDKEAMKKGTYEIVINDCKKQETMLLDLPLI